MEKGINFATKELKIKLMQDISIANLPPVVVRSILQELLMQIQVLEEQIIQKEQMEFETQHKKINNKEVSNEKS